MSAVTEEGWLDARGLESTPDRHLSVSGYELGVDMADGLFGHNRRRC